MNPFERPLQEVLDALEGVGIGYMIVGSFASNLYGSPRATQDVDIVTEPNLGKLSRFLSVLGAKGFYTPPMPVVERALHAHKPFNLIHIETGFKVDLVPRRKRPFSTEEFSRRHYVEFLGKPRAFVTPEDTLLAKLEWAKRGGSARQSRTRWQSSWV